MALSRLTRDIPPCHVLATADDNKRNETMSKQVLTTWNVENMEQMMVALTEAVDEAGRLGHHPSTVYPNMLQVALVEETLTDGSTVLNLHFHEGTRDLASVFGVLGRTKHGVPT